MQTVNDLVQSMARFRALEPPLIEEVNRRLLPRHADNPRGLAAELLKLEWLSAFQINRLFSGRGAELLLGNYVLLERIAEGGTGQVFKARNWKLGRTVALKLIRKELLTNPVVLGRFRREIEATAQLDHPNIIRALDAGEADGGLYIVMEYVEGTDLGRLVRTRGTIPVARACEYIRQAALGLHYAHERGMVHRDIKPPNLLRAEAGEVIKILDLGLARLQDGATARGAGQPVLTQLGVIVGTVDFMAPEQARDSRGVDLRADLYSLGCTLHYLLTGRPPYGGATPSEKLFRHSMDPLPALPGIAAPVRSVLHKLMAKKPADRYRSAADVASVLRNLVERRA